MFKLTHKITLDAVYEIDCNNIPKNCKILSNDISERRKDQPAAFAKLRKRSLKSLKFSRRNFV